MDPLQNLKVATRCSMIWEGMKGNDRVRQCEGCRLGGFSERFWTRRRLVENDTVRSGDVDAELHERAER